MDEFKDAIRVSIEALDTLIDENADNHPLEVHKINSLNYRNIGLGLMGFGTALFKLKVKYGSKECLNLVKDIFSFLFREAVIISSELALKKGSFPKYKDIVYDSEIIKNHFNEEERIKLKKQGIRNCSLLSIAPNGSISTMLGVTGGCEAEFALKFTRKTESLDGGKDKYYDVYCTSIKEYQQLTKDKHIPDFFVASADIKWEDRIKVQAEMQNHIDTAISSTINLPKETTLESVEKLYLSAWQQGIKGITIFRDGCKRLGILTNENPTEESRNIKPHMKSDLSWGTILESSDDMIGKKRKLISGCGTLHCQAFFDPMDGDFQEVYLSKGSTGGCNNFMVALSRMISQNARSGVGIYAIVDQLNSTGACPSYVTRTAIKKDTSKGSCCPMAVGKALLEMQLEMWDELGFNENEEPKKIILKKINHTKEKISGDIVKSICPECGDEVNFTGGCNSCPSCGWSQCS